MDILVLGVGEAADPDFCNASVVVGAGGFRLLIDCGHSVPTALWRALPEPDAIDAVYLTHPHPDHMFGLVPVLIEWTDRGRRAPLTIVVGPDVRAQLGLLFAAAGLDPYRSLSYPLRWLGLEEAGRIGPFEAAFAPTLHAAPNHAIRLDAGGRRFAYSGDGRPTPESVALFRGADLLFHECYTLHPEPGQFHHADLATVERVARESEAETVRLHHLRKDQRAAVAAAVAGHPRIALAEPGERITL